MDKIDLKITSKDCTTLLEILDYYEDCVGYRESTNRFMEIFFSKRDELPKAIAGDKCE